jgi:small subunit ribosomal protein S20
VANTKSAEKRIRTSLKAHERNKAVKSQVRTLMKNVEKAVGKSSEDLQKLLNAAISFIDKAVSYGILHKNNAARRKSRLMAKVRKAAKK